MISWLLLAQCPLGPLCRSDPCSEQCPCCVLCALDSLRPSRECEPGVSQSPCPAALEAASRFLSTNGRVSAAE